MKFESEHVIAMAIAAVATAAIAGIAGKTLRQKFHTIGYPDGYNQTCDETADNIVRSIKEGE